MAGLSIYVGNLPHSANEGRIWQMCMESETLAIPNTVSEPIDRFSQIVFDTVTEAVNAVNVINGSLLDGVMLSAGFCCNGLKLYVTNFPPGMNRNEIVSILRTILPRLRFAFENNNDFGERTFESQSGVTHFLGVVNSPRFINLNGMELFCSYYRPPDQETLDWLRDNGLEVPRSVLLDLRRVQVMNIPLHYSEREVVALLLPFGPIAGVSAMFMSYEDGNQRLNATVTYLETAAACNAIRELDQRIIEEEFEIRLSWAPLVDN